MAYYVDEEGNILEYRMASPTHIKLSDGRVVDPDDHLCELFATKKSARKFAELLKEGNSFSEAHLLHNQWTGRFTRR